MKMFFWSFSKKIEIGRKWSQSFEQSLLCEKIDFFCVF